jgi:hypothetical protein
LTGSTRLILAALAALLALALAASAALAHVERTAYWPNPKPDTSVKPAAGGKVPKVRSLASAARRKQKRGVKVLVVCKSNSLKLAAADIRHARTKGFRYRPTGGLQKISKQRAAKLRKLNRRFFKKCRFHAVQPAATKANNNDRIVIMPGLYTEPNSRKVAKLPPECDKYRETSERGSGAVSYAYQVHCPNAQNLVAVIGRADTGKPEPASSPTGRPDPHGLPNEGKCIRCNLQMEGSGASPDSVVLDSGRVASGNHGPIDAKKDVTLKVDRADGFVGLNMTLRHAAEHDVYTLEVDGYRLTKMKFFYAGEYGTLTFTSDHGVTSRCEAAGNGDSGLYPGGAPDSNGTERQNGFYPKARLNQLLTQCDSHHNNLGYSGTMGNATHVTKVNFYDNAAGIATDSFFAGGHPGYPQSSAVFENNRIYSNNFNVYAKGSDVESRVPVPLGVGILIAGGNTDTVRGNYIYDNWRRGTMLMAVPDAISCAPGVGTPTPPCVPSNPATTSNGNRYHNNVMSRTPDGRQMPNGVDFWWDEYASNKGNCWYDNTGQNGSKDYTSDPPPPPQHGQSIPGFLPEACDSPGSVGKGNPQKEAVLGACATDFETNSEDSTACDWFAPPPKPGASGQSASQVTTGVPAGTNSAAGLPHLCTLIGNSTSLTCSPFQHRLGG